MYYIACWGMAAHLWTCAAPTSELIEAQQKIDSHQAHGYAVTLIAEPTLEEATAEWQRRLKMPVAQP